MIGPHCSACPRPPGRLRRWLAWLWIRLRGKRPIKVAVWRRCRVCEMLSSWDEWA